MNFEEKLIREVRQKECLYNMSSPDYQNFLMKEKLWQDIALRLSVPDHYCKKRWKTLRDTYKRIKQRLRYQLGRPKDWTTPWKYFELLSFLDKVAFTRVKKKNMDLCVEVPDAASSDASSSPSTPVSEPLAKRRRRNELQQELSKVLCDSTKVTMKNMDNSLEAPETYSSDVCSRPSTPMPKQLAKRRRHNELQEELSKVLSAATQLLEGLPPAVEEHRKESRSSIIEFMIALGNRMERSGISEDEMPQLELETTQFVFSKLNELKSKRQNKELVSFSMYEDNNENNYFTPNDPLGEVPILLPESADKQLSIVKNENRHLVEKTEKLQLEIEALMQENWSLRKPKSKNNSEQSVD